MHTIIVKLVAQPIYEVPEFAPVEHLPLGFMY